MTKRTFTADDNGEKWELEQVIIGPVGNGNIVIKPIPKAVEKNTWYFEFYEIDGFGQKGVLRTLVKREYELTEPTAQAIADMLSAAMEYLADPADESAGEVPRTYALFCETAKRARALQQEEA